jgi:hypothetical protein
VKNRPAASRPSTVLGKKNPWRPPSGGFLPIRLKPDPRAALRAMQVCRIIIRLEIQQELTHENSEIPVCGHAGGHCCRFLDSLL